MIIRDNGTAIRFADDLNDLANWLSSEARVWRQQSSRGNRASNSWDLGLGMDGALRMAKTGWSEGMRNVMFAAQEVVAAPRTSTIRYDVAGEFPDVGRFVVGDPLHMRSHRKQRDHHQLVHLIVNVCCSASVSASTFANYGGAVAALVDQLENRGRRVELDVVGVNSHKGRGRSICGWKVKQASDPLDLSAVAYSIAHPAAFRRLMFAMWERLPRSWEDAGYGTVAELTRKDAEKLEAPDAVLLDGVGRSNEGISAVEMNKRLRANVKRALGIDMEVE